MLFVCSLFLFRYFSFDFWCSLSCCLLLSCLLQNTLFNTFICVFFSLICPLKWPQLHHSYHRHSVSNLSGMTPMVKTTLTITPAAPIPQSQKTSNSCVGLHLSPQLSSHLSGSNSSSSSAITPITSTIIPSGDYCKSFIYLYCCQLINNRKGSIFSYISSHFPFFFPFSNGLKIKNIEGLSCDSGHQFSMDWTPDSGRSHSTGASGGGSGGSSYPKQASNKHLLGDISPYKHLESLSLQMTEQAIN